MYPMHIIRSDEVRLLNNGSRLLNPHLTLKCNTKVLINIGDVKNARKTFPVAMASTVGLMTVSTERADVTLRNS